MFRRLSTAFRGRVLGGAALIGLISCGGSAGPAVASPAGPFAGQWSAHSTTLTIDRTGHGTLVWRIYRTCGQDPPPCDTITGDNISAGGHATILVTAQGAVSARGRILSSSDPADVPPGPLTARLDQHADVVYFSPFPAGAIPVCGPRARPDLCGA